MKYEFHVGDYVEDNYGKVGYINSVKYTKSNKGVFYDIEIVYYNADIVGAFHGDQSLIQDCFNHIGKYDFTKPENPKEIERLKELERENIWNERSGGWLYAQHRKINELVDAVNELRKERT